jgi:hypothetical protein
VSPSTQFPVRYRQYIHLSRAGSSSLNVAELALGCFPAAGDAWYEAIDDDDDDEHNLQVTLQAWTAKAIDIDRALLSCTQSREVSLFPRS